MPWTKAAHQKFQKPERPDVFRQYDYRAFLKEWFSFLKATEPGFSVRALTEEAGLATGYLSMVVVGKRSLTSAALARLLPHLQLNRQEQKHFENLVRLGSPDSPKAKVLALTAMSKSTLFRRKNPNEAELFVYMSHWFYIAIREMATLEGFQTDPVWIQQRLNASVPLADIKVALDFLIRHCYLETRPDGAVVPPKETLECKGEVFWMALSQYHKKMLALASDAIETLPDESRELRGYTLTMNKKRYQAACEILERATKEIKALDDSSPDDAPSDAVYQLEYALFALTRRDAK